MSPLTYNYIQRDNQRFFKDSAIPVTIYRKNQPIELKDGILLRSKSVRKQYQRKEKKIERPIFSQVPFYFHGTSVLVSDGKYFPRTICCVNEG